MKNFKKTLMAIFFLLFMGNFLRSQQTTIWTSVSPTIWESTTTDGLVRVECRVSAGVSILGPETMDCTSAATYSDPAVFGSSSIEISASSTSIGTLEFHFFDATTGNPAYMVNPILHADKIGTFAIVGLFSDAATGNFDINNGTWTEISSNGPIFQSTATRFSIDDDALLFSGGGECGNGTNTGSGGGSMRFDGVTQSIDMDVEVTGGLLSLLTAADEVEFVLSNLIIADPSIEVTKTVIENFGNPISTGNSVDYTITIENTGNVTIHNIRLTDTFTDADLSSLSLGTGPTFDSATLGSTHGTLFSSEVATYLASYSLTTAELEAGGVINQVEVLGNSPYGTDDISDISDDGDATDGNMENDPTESFFPHAIDDSATVCEIGAIDISVLTNDDFGGNGPSTGSIFLVTPPSAGNALVNDNTTPTDPTDDFITYTSNSGYVGSDSFVYGISDTKGNAHHATVSITEQPAPDAGTNGTLTICEGDTVTTTQLFNALGGSPDSGGSWSPALAGTGTYTYTVSATTPCTTDSTAEVVVTEQPTPDAGINGTLTICEGTTLTTAQLFSALGGTPDPGGSWSPALAGAGTYTYTVAATAPCTSDATSEVVVSEQAAPDAGNNGTLTICEGDTITTTQLFNALGGSPDSGGSWSPTLAGAGTYTYTVTATAPCTTDSTAEVVVTEQAAPDVGTNGTLTICEGDTATTTQLFNALGGSPDSGGTWSPALAGAGTYLYNIGGAICPEISSTVTVTEEAQPDAGSDASLEICAGTTVTQLQLFSLLGTADNSGTWNPNPEGGADGMYAYTVTGTICPDTSATVTVSISMLDSDGDTVTDCDENMHGTDPFNDCESIGGRPLPTSDCDNDRLTEEEEALLGTNPLNPDTDGDGVIDGQEVTDATNPLDICDFVVENQTITPTNMWNSSDCDSDNMTNQDEINLGTDPTNPDTDGDTIIDGQEVLDMTDSLDPCDSKGGTPPLGASCEIYIENDMVTPGDIMNGNFEIINIHLFPDNAVEIHNRWGQLVWETEVYDNRNNAFDGVTKGKLAILENQKLPSGVYFYKVKYVANDQDKILSGYLYINR